MNPWAAISLALYVIGLVGMDAMSRDFSNVPRSWKTWANLAAWPVTIPIAWVLDQYDRFKGR